MESPRSVPVMAKVTKVLGEYDHRLEFPVVRDFAIIYGPNGVGKTKFLEIVHALSRLDGRSLVRLPFESAVLEYSDGHKLSATQSIAQGDGEQNDERRQISFALTYSDHEDSSWTFTGSSSFERWLIEQSPWRPLPNSDYWEDRRDGEIVSLAELEQQYPERTVISESDVPPLFRKHFEEHPTFLIETQRLRISHSAPRPNQRWARLGRNRSASRISEQAETMRRLVNEAQTEHSRITQQLDRTFPNRVLARSDSNVESDAAIRQRYNEQNTFRSRLGRVASVALEDALSLPDRDLLDWELGLLHLYLDDAEKKLAPFEILLQKIELLEKIVNSRLHNKHIQVTAESGLVVCHNGDERVIELEALSSGEQHEIILLFDLLFNVPQGALVLIDEPEISLHIVWQMAFIPDVQQIAELSGFRFVVATHSPQIINDAWDHAVRLGPTEVGFS